LFRPKNERTQREDLVALMVRCSSPFSQVLSLIDHRVFYELVFKHDAEHHAKGYNSRAVRAHFMDHAVLPVAQAQEHSGVLRRSCILCGQDQASGIMGFHRKSMLSMPMPIGSP
jgi:hypothetical protein